jgi:hypothetical protein
MTITAKIKRAGGTPALRKTGRARASVDCLGLSGRSMLRQYWVGDDDEGGFRLGSNEKSAGSAAVYCVADFSPNRRMRSCSFLRSVDGAFGLKATRYHSGCVRSRLRRVRVPASLFGCRAMFSRIAE